jgi:hypothetical protein
MCLLFEIASRKLSSVFLVRTGDMGNRTDRPPATWVTLSLGWREVVDAVGRDEWHEGTSEIHRVAPGRAALKRAGVHPPKRGAHVFRHTAACQLLRQGVAVERNRRALAPPFRRYDWHLREGGHGALGAACPTLAGGGAIAERGCRFGPLQSSRFQIQLNDHEGITQLANRPRLTPANAGWRGARR